MQVVCTKTCQIRIDEQITLIERGTVMSLDELPNNGCFNELQGRDYQIDFLTAGEDELMKVKWKFSDAAAAILDEYDMVLEKEEGDRKSDVVARILDIRYRSV